MTWLLSLLLGMVVSAIVLIIVDRMDIGVKVDGFSTAIVAAVVIALLNLVLGNILRVLALPLNLITLCLLSWLIGWIINAIVIYVSAKLVKGFEIFNFLSAFIAAAVIAVIQWGVNYLLNLIA